MEGKMKNLKIEIEKKTETIQDKKKLNGLIQRNNIIKKED